MGSFLRGSCFFSLKRKSNSSYGVGEEIATTGGKWLFGLERGERSCQGEKETTRREQEWQSKLATHSKQEMDAIRQRIVEVLHMCKEVCKAQKLKLEQGM